MTATTMNAPDATRLDTVKAELTTHFSREHATTMRVVRAMPENRADFRPHARSATALELVATLLREQAGILAVLGGTWSMPPSFPAPPPTWMDGLRALDHGGTRVVAALEAMSAARLTDTVPFFTGPGQVGPMPVRDLLWFWLHDTIHHRGQLSVYLRMAGGQVPAIYGPSGDEPWT